MIITDKIAEFMQIPKVRIYLAIIVVLGTALLLLKLNPSLTGLVINNNSSGSFMVFEPKDTGLLSKIIGFAMIMCVVTLLFVGVQKKRVKMAVEKKEVDERNVSIESLLKDNTFGKEENKLEKIGDKEKAQENKTAKQKIILTKTKQKPSEKLMPTVRTTKLKMKVGKLMPEVEGIKPREFDNEETTFTDAPKPAHDSFERKYESASIIMTTAEVITSDMKQKIVNAGLNDYLDKHAAQPEEYIQLASGIHHRKRFVKIFKLERKEDFYPIIDCMRENEHLIIIYAAKMAETDPEMLKKFAKQLDYVGMVYDARIAAIDDKNFAVIPGFARFEP